MDNDDFLKELEQITNSLEKDYNEVIKPAQSAVSENVINQAKSTAENKTIQSQIENQKNDVSNNNKNPTNANANNPFGNFANPFANFGMPFMNPNANPEDCFKELQKLISTDIDVDENDPESQEMFKLLDQNMKNLSTQLQELTKTEGLNSNNNVNNSNPFTPPSFPSDMPRNPNNTPSSEFESDFFKNFNKNLFGSFNTPQNASANLSSENTTGAQNKDTYPNNMPISSKPDEKKEEKASNPFVDAYSEMSQTPLDQKNIMDLFAGMGNLGDEANLNMENFNEGNIQNIMQLYEILSKLSDQKESNKNLSEEEKEKELKILFEHLLEFLLKSEMLAEPLSQIKSSVNSYLDKNKEKLNADEQEKYKSMLDYIDVINSEITKPNPNKPLIIDTFFKLHEMSNLDNNILDQINPNFKEFSDLFGKKN